MVSLIVLASAGLLALIGEALHQRRVRRLAHLAFGPSAAPRPWVRMVPFLRVLSHSGLAWGLCTLMLIEPSVHRSDEVPDDNSPQVASSNRSG